MKTLIFLVIFLLTAEFRGPADAQVTSQSPRCECGQINLDYFNNAKKLSNSHDECGPINEDYFYNEQITTNLDEFPWMARIAIKTDDQEISYDCQGVLISKRYVLSMAHCFRSYPAHAVVLGDWDTANNITEKDCNKEGLCGPVPQQYDIAKITVHACYRRGSSDNDIALLRLASEVIFSDYIRPICLPTAAVEDNPPFVGHYYHLAGSAVGKFNTDIRRHIFKTLSHVVALERCRSLYAPYKISDNNVCGNCQAPNDLRSGAALMDVKLENWKPKNFYLVGMLSAGMTLCDHGRPMVFVKISSYLDWIKLNMIE